MDCGKIICPVAVGDEDPEITNENKQLNLDAERGEDTDDNEPKSLIMEIYPWIQQFKKMCRSSLFQPSMTSLKHLMMYYTRNIRLSVNECYTKPLRAEKVKDSVSETLLFFLYYYRVIGEDHDRASYMELLTDLLAMYIDMELKASKKGREHSSKISGRLSSCLHVYLEHSTEHLLDTLLKVHFMTHNYHEILDPVITKIFKGVQEHPNSSVMYVRYFLVYRLWKKMSKNVDARNQINVLALASLGSPPNDLPSFFVESVLPKVPNSQKISTKLLLLNKFDVDKCREEFFKFCKRDRGSNASKPDQRTCHANTQPSSVPEDNDTRVSNVHNNVVNVSIESRVKSSSPNLSNNKPEITSEKIKFSNKSPSLKSLSLRKIKKSNGIVMIDLTSDNVTEKVIRPKKTRRKPIWLEKVNKPTNDAKIDTTTEDSTLGVQRLDDIMNFDCLRIDNSRCDENTDVKKFLHQQSSLEEQTSTEDSSPKIDTRISELSTTEKTNLSMTNTIESNKSTENINLNNDDDRTMIIEKAKNITEKNNTIDEKFAKLSEPATSISNASTMELETTTTIVDPSSTDEFSIPIRTINDKTKSPTPNTFHVRDEHSRTFPSSKFENNKPLETPLETLKMAIKAENVTDDNDEIINEKIILRDVVSPTMDYESSQNFSYRRNDDCQRTIGCSTKIRETEFQENIDGLSLLASVSQRVSHLTTTTTTQQQQQQIRNHPVNGELIKVKNYAQLANLNTTESSESSIPNFCTINETDVVNRIVGIYPEDAMDKVAYEVEVTSAEEMNFQNNVYDDNSTSIVGYQPNVDDSCRLNKSHNENLISPETPSTNEKDDNNVILNGETVVLFQKSPNSNLYIINKAVENRDHANDDITSAIRDTTEHVNDNVSFAYEFPYENVYRNQSSITYDSGQYNRDATVQESRRNKKIITTVDSTLETKKITDVTESSKNVGSPINVIGKINSVNRKKNSNTLNRRRRIKQEYNACENELSNLITGNYGIKECSKEHVESGISSIHIPSTHSNKLSSIYTTYNGPTEMYLPCHKNYNSITCGLPVCSKSTNSKKSHCSCLNCGYGIVAHCGDCIIPNNDNLSSTMENGSYYLPIHTSVQTATVQDCSTKDSHVKIYDDKLICKFENTAIGGKTMDNVGVKCESKEIYRSEIDNKLPLKKRFKSMMSMSYDETSIKREKTQSYPGTPMISIAAIDSRDSSRQNFVDDDIVVNNSLDLTMQERCVSHVTSKQTSEMIRRDYRKDMMMMMMPPSPVSNVCRNRNNSNVANCNTIGNDNNVIVNNVTSSNINSSSSITSSNERKRKRKTISDTSLSRNVNFENHRVIDDEKMSKTTTKQKDASTTIVGTTTKRQGSSNKSQSRQSDKSTDVDSIATKNFVRQTRSSKRNLPKVNYMYTDGDSDCNPTTGGFKRKRKKTSR